MTESADVTLDDLNEEQLQVVEVIGLEAYKRLIHYYAGTSIYIPSSVKSSEENVMRKYALSMKKMGISKHSHWGMAYQKYRYEQSSAVCSKTKKSIHTKDESHCLIYRKFKESSKV